MSYFTPSQKPFTLNAFPLTLVLLIAFLILPLSAAAQSQLVRIENADKSAEEKNEKKADVKLRRVNAGSQPINVQYSVTGSATNGVDYKTLSGAITIPANRNDVTMTVEPIDDEIFEGPETIVITVSSANCVDVAGSCTATVTIDDNEPPSRPTVTVSGSTNVIEGSAGPANAVVSRTGPTVLALTVRYSVGGTATAADYTSLSGSITIPAGASSASIPIHWTNDALEENNETIVITISNNAAYEIGSAGTMTLKIIDNDARVTLQANSSTVLEGDTSGFTVTRSMVTDTALTVRFLISGTASNGTDYSTITSPVTILPNSTTAVLGVSASNDGIPEQSESITITLENAMEYVAGTPATATINIAANGISSVNISVVGPPAPPLPTQNVSVGIQLVSPAPTQLDGTLSISFVPAAGLPAGYRDPALQFLSGGTALNFSVAPQATTATMPMNGGIQQGTVAGDIVVTLTRLQSQNGDVLQQPAPSRTITIPRLPAVISPNSVRITNMTENSFDVDVMAYSTPRNLASASYTFVAGSGTAIEGTSTFSLDLRDAVGQWYASSQSLQFGSMLRIRSRFTVAGNVESLQSVTVTLTNSVGTSLPVTGGK